MSLDLNTDYVATHWDAVLEGAERSGRTPDRRDWRLVREVVVAETDEQAFRYAVDGMIGRNMREYVLPTFKMIGMTKFYKHDPAGARFDDVTPEYLAENTFVVGSVETVVDKLEATYDQVGGFGHLLILGFDYSDNPGPWKESMRLLAEEVMPQAQRANREKAGDRDRLADGSGRGSCRGRSSGHRPIFGWHAEDDAGAAGSVDPGCGGGARRRHRQRMPERDLRHVRRHLRLRRLRDGAHRRALRCGAGRRERY